MQLGTVESAAKLWGDVSAGHAAPAIAADGGTKIARKTRIKEDNDPMLQLKRNRTQVFVRGAFADVPLYKVIYPPPSVLARTRSSLY